MRSPWYSPLTRATRTRRGRVSRRFIDVPPRIVTGRFHSVCCVAVMGLVYPAACADGQTAPLATSRAVLHDDGATLEAIRNELGPGFRIDSTDHFAVVSDAPASTVQALGATAEYAFESVQ